MADIPNPKWLPQDFWDFAEKYPNDTYEEVYKKYQDANGQGTDSGVSGQP